MMDMGKNFQVIQGSRGQATTETVLLMAVSTVLVFAVASQVIKPFNSWMQNYMGAYLQCLLDAGELPSLGYRDDSSICNSQFRAFTLSEGRSRLPPGSGAGAQGRSGESAPTSSMRPSGSGDGEGSGGSAGRVSRSSSRGFDFRNNTGSDSVATAAENQTVVGRAPRSEFWRFQRVEVAGPSRSSSERIPVTGLSGLLKEEQEKQKRASSRRLPLMEIESKGPEGAKRFVVKAPPPRGPAQAEEESPWSIGNLIRWTLMAMVILALILFIAGQVLQISKSTEK